jgi:hypothetical protein
MGLENYMDSLSFDVQGVADLNYLEVVLHASQRIFLDFTNGGPAVESNLFPQRESVYLEFARNYTTPNNYYGRLGLGVLEFFPQSQTWIKIAVATGILATETNPWSLNMHFNYFSSIQGNNRNIIIAVTSEKLLDPDSDSPLSLGGFISWGYRTRPLSEDIAATYEQILFSIGPALDWKSSVGTFQFKLPWRLWIDRQYEIINGASVPGNPTDLRFVPDFEVNWTWAF